MSVNKITFVINSRSYTVVAEETPEYLEKLCAHVNEKVESVLRGGQNIMGERPIVLAALNICDEYYKQLEENEALREKTAELKEKNGRLEREAESVRDELDMVKSGQVSIDEAAMRAEISDAKEKLSGADNKIKFLEGQVKSLKEKIVKLEERDKKREQDFLDLIDKQ